MYTPCSVAGRVSAEEPHMFRDVVEMLVVVSIWEEILMVVVDGV